jgi:hypothetical protein
MMACSTAHVLFWFLISPQLSGKQKKGIRPPLKRERWRNLSAIERPSALLVCLVPSDLILGIRLAYIGNYMQVDLYGMTIQGIQFCREICERRNITISPYGYIDI